jgi:L-lactate dehydrogenase
VDVVLHNQRAIMTVCAPQDDVFGVQNVTVALPILLSGSGVVQTLPVHLTTEEAQKLQASAAIVKAAIGELDSKG